LWGIDPRVPATFKGVPSGKRHQLRQANVVGDTVCSVWQIRTDAFSDAEKAELQQVGATLKVIGVAGVVDGTPRAITAAYQPSAEPGGGVIWDITSESTDTQTSGPDGDSESFESHSTGHSSDGEDFTDDESSETHPDGSSEEHEDRTTSDRDQNTTHTHTDTTTDTDGNSAVHTEATVTDSAGNRTTTITDDTYDKSGNRTSHHEEVTHDNVPGSQEPSRPPFTLKVQWEGTQNLGGESLSYSGTVIVPMTFVIPGFEGDAKGAWNSTMTGKCTGGTTMPVTLQVAATGVSKLSFSVSEVSTGGTTKLKCGPASTSSKVAGSRRVHTFSLTPTDGASWTEAQPGLDGVRIVFTYLANP
jgi:hypothetical protein